jgi:hypothetical protein
LFIQKKIYVYFMSINYFLIKMENRDNINNKNESFRYKKNFIYQFFFKYLKKLISNYREDTDSLVISFNNMELSRKQIVLYIAIPCFVAVLIGFLIGFLSGYLPEKNKNDSNKNNFDANLLKYYESLVRDIDYSYFETLNNEVKASIIRENLKYL